MLRCVQVAYAIASPLPQDKSPNVFGQKAIVVDCTGVVVDKNDEWLATAASVGSHLIRLAIAQQIIDFEDLDGLVPGERFKLEDLIRRRTERRQVRDRYSPDPRHVGDMCAPPTPCQLCKYGRRCHSPACPQLPYDGTDAGMCSAAGMD